MNRKIQEKLKQLIDALTVKELGLFGVLLLMAV